MPNRLRGHRLATGALWIATFICAAWAIERTLGLETGYPWVAVMAWTPYVALLAPAVCALAVVARHRGAATLAGAATVLLIVAVLPRAIGGGHDVVGAPGPELRILSANVKVGQADPAALVQLARRVNANVVCIEELTPEIVRALRAAGMNDLYRYRDLEPEDDAAGTGIYARHPIERLPDAEPVGYPHRTPQARLNPRGGVPVELTCAHPVPPNEGRAAVWAQGLQSLPDAEEGIYRVIAGDLNATLDHDELRDLLASGYLDAGDATGNGLVPTFPGGVWPPPVTIDHVLADERIGIDDFGVEDVPGSDHRAVWAKLRVPAA